MPHSFASAISAYALKPPPTSKRMCRTASKRTNIARTRHGPPTPADSGFGVWHSARAESDIRQFEVKLKARFGV